MTEDTTLLTMLVVCVPFAHVVLETLALVLDEDTYLVTRLAIEVPHALVVRVACFVVVMTELALAFAFALLCVPFA